MERLSDISYFKTGSTYNKLHKPSDFNQLRSAILEIKNTNTPFFVLGKGSNSLISDMHWDGDIISLSNLNNYFLDKDHMICEAGLENTLLSNIAYENSYLNFHWLNYLPGQIGASVRINARCYGHEFSQIVDKIETIDLKAKRKYYLNKDLFLGYKNTTILSSKEIVYRVWFKTIYESDKDLILEKMEYCKNDRTKKKQFEFPSCGCIFKNDYLKQISAGFLLDKAGVKKMSYNKAFVSDNHANFIYNKGSSADDILKLSFLMRDKVYELFGIWLDYEMQLLGKFDKYLTEEFYKKKKTNTNDNLLENLKTEFKKVINRV